MKRFFLALFAVAGLLASPSYSAPVWPTSPSVGDTYEYLGRSYEYNGEIWRSIGGLGPGIRVQQFTASGTYTPSPGMRYAIVELQGVGGGGGADDSASSTTAATSDGGAAGAYCRNLYTAEEMGASVAFTLGTPGAGATAVGDGGNGTNSTFKDMTAGGGAGGQDGTDTSGRYVGYKAAGGVCTNGGSGSRNGENGRAGVSTGDTVSTTHTALGGNGASSFFGIGGSGGRARGGVPLQDNGSAPSGYGGGGGGGVSVHAGTVGQGSDGGPALLQITEFLGESYGSAGKQGFPGETIWFSGSTCPDGTIPENGATVSRTTYPILWASVSDDAVASPTDAEYGTGDGSTTFVLKNMSNQYGWIVSALSTPATYGSVLESAAPDIDGTFQSVSGIDGSGILNFHTGAFSKTDNTGNIAESLSESSGVNSDTQFFEASDNETTYSDAVDEISVPSIPKTPCLVY